MREETVARLFVVIFAVPALALAAVLLGAIIEHFVS